ncbi:uroporphyrinogen decarboxylase family protein [Parasphaerochaeta coccoides]|uniref:Uroporphyrinogen decarboxylase (URO-D) domain-containing protein n=1 Tax=Parasphaerochaeta coccoides (strain ATCC BAA-1237 / DSM 17374 / SPN1) TaxID=760011 RepID=F4GJ59_PARC1|nr:uroporphyrinogen decarboxylase family protein [Parasphaerochaeta coccoides]AEC01354.1 hypothetical protein Spico_0112 [Parasphaerochaeta coccoides DSM 17374]
MISHTQRVKAALEGKILDRPAFVAWGPHMNLVDRNAKDFAKATIDYQNAYGFDFIKVMSNGLYFPEAFGQKIRPAEHILDETWQNTQINVINDPHEWARLKVPSMKEGVFAREIEVVKRLVDYFQGDVPVLPTVFSPFIWMGEMTGGYFRQETIVAHFKYSEKYARIGLAVVNETNELLMEEFVKAGADGFFLGYQAGMAGIMGKEMFEEYGKKYDIRNIQKIKDRTWFNMAHVCHGDAALSEWFLDYPVEALNWADQDSEQHSFAEMRRLTDVVLVGGLNHSTHGSYKDLSVMIKSPSDLSGTCRDEIKARIKVKIRNAIAAAGSKVIISGGCGWGIGSLPRFGLWEEAMEEIGQDMNVAP